MKQYEITFLTTEDFGEKPIAKELDALGGKITSVLPSMQKQLAYKIKKAKEAFYTTVIFTIEGDKLVELNRKLNLKDEILRFLIVSYKEVKPETVKVPKSLTRKTTKEEPVEAPSETEKEETKAEVDGKIEKLVSDDKKEAPAKKAKAKKEIEKVVEEIETKELPKKKEKISEAELGEEERLKALDEKLNELLKE